MYINKTKQSFRNFNKILNQYGVLSNLYKINNFSTINDLVYIQDESIICLIDYDALYLWKMSTLVILLERQHK